MRYKQLVSKKLDELNNIVLGLNSLLSQNPTREQLQNQIEILVDLIKSHGKTPLVDVGVTYSSIKHTEEIEEREESIDVKPVEVVENWEDILNS